MSANEGNMACGVRADTFATRKAGGAAWAREYVEYLKLDPECKDLRGWVSDAEGLLFGGKDHELDAFYDTLRDAIKESAHRFPADRLTRYLFEIGTSVLAIRNLGQQALDDAGDQTRALHLGIMALAEKVGYLSDKCLELLGKSSGVAGDFDAWANRGGKADRQRILERGQERQQVIREAKEIS